MTRFEKIQTEWTSEDMADFVVTLMKNVLKDYNKDLELDSIRWELISAYYNDFLNEEEE